MSHILTQCPFCQTTFKVSDAQMQAANGVVRCGSCMDVFLAPQHRVILKDKPPRSARQDAAAFSADFPAALTHSERDALYGTKPQWQVLDSEDPEDAEAEEDAFWSAPDEAEDVFPATADPESATEADEAADTDLYSSWEAEAPGRPSDDTHPSSGLDESGYWDDDEALADVNIDDNEDSVKQTAPETPARPGYGGILNPASYAITRFSVEHVLPALSGTAANEAITDGEKPYVERSDHEKAVEDQPDEDEADDHTPFAAGDDPTASGEAFDAIHAMAIPEGEQFPRLPGHADPAAHRSPVIIPDRSERIPTLMPDVVAREEIPAGSLRAQTIAWFQSVRQSFQDSRTQPENYAGTDEKAEIRSRLVALRDDDSLELVDSEHFDALDDDPVELPLVVQQWDKLKTLGMAGVCGLLLLVLCGQYLWFNLDNLVIAGRLPAITGLLCQTTSCPDDNMIDLSALVTEELVVRTHPDAANALQVDFIFRNDNNREQPFPLVELNFTDISGDIIANRVFTSEQYLPPEMQLFTHMPAHSSIQVSLELVDPGAAATGYFLVFRNP